MQHCDIINSIIKKYNYKKYLEIGIYKKYNFNVINCDYKKCVDPISEFNADFVMTSDDFFTINKDFFDLIFIDGLHYNEQVFKDIINSLKCLNLGGTIICHDLLPDSEIEQVVPMKTKSWSGDCWKAWMRYRSMFDDVEMYVIDTDHGVGIIRRGKQEKIVLTQDLTWEFFCKNKDLMNIISEEQFLGKLK